MEQTLGKRIVHHRKKLNLTQDQLAERLGVTAQAVSKWENDQSCPDIATLPKLAEIFGITTDELLGHESKAQAVHQAEVVEDTDGETNGIHVNNGKWEFHWDSGRRGGIGFACWVLLMGILLLTKAILKLDVGFWSLAWPSFLLILGLFGGKKFSFMRLGFVLFGSYFLLDNIGLLPFDLGGEIIWPALVILFGLGLLADALRKPKHPIVRFHHKKGEHIDRKKVSRCIVADDSFDCENCFGDENHLVCADHLRQGNVENNFGSATVDLSGVQSVADNCHIHVECNFGEVILLVPRQFAACISQETAFGSVETKGEPDSAPSGNITIACEANFGTICIEYI